MGNFSPLNQDEIQITKPKWCNVRDYRSLFDFSNFTNKANSHTSEMEVHTKLKLCHFAAMLQKQSHFVKKVSSQLPGLDCSYGKIFIPVAEILVDWTGLPSHMNTSKF